MSQSKSEENGEKEQNKKACPNTDPPSPRSSSFSLAAPNNGNAPAFLCDNDTPLFSSNPFVFGASADLKNDASDEEDPRDAKKIVLANDDSPKLNGLNVNNNNNESSVFGFDSTSTSEYVFSPGSSNGSGSRSTSTPSAARRQKSARYSRNNRGARRTTNTSNASVTARRQVVVQPNPNIPALPSEVWAQILEFSLYDDVARMARVAPSFLHDTMPLLKSLYFTNDASFSREANQAARFRNGRLERIFIDGTFKIVPEDGKDRINFSFQESASPSAFIDFVAELPSIKNVFFGAGKKETVPAMLDRLQLDKDPSSPNKYVFCKRRKEPRLYIRAVPPSDMVPHANLFRDLIANYSSGRLSQELQVHGIPCPVTYTVYDHRFQYVGEGARPVLCNGISESFPVDQVLSWVVGSEHGSDHYFPHTRYNEPEFDVALQMFLERPGALEALLAESPRSIFMRILPGFGALCIVEGLQAIGYIDEYLRGLQLLVNIGLDPSSVTVEDLYEAFESDDYIRKQGRPYRIREADYNTLVQVGFALDRCFDIRITPEKDFTGFVSI